MKPHPWNDRFTWQATGHDQFDEQGYFLLEDAIDKSDLAEVTAEIDPFEGRTTEFLRTQPDGKLMIADADAITFTTHLVTRSPRLRGFAAAPVFRQLCSQLVGAKPRLYWDQAVYKKPETPKEFPWHQDNGYTFVEPQQYLTCWVPLVDATVDNGCPWVVPGVHRRGTLEHWWTDVGYQCIESPPDAVAVPAPAGSVVVFSSLTPHRTGPNLTDAVRKAYILQYAPDGAEALRGDASQPPSAREPQDDPDRQFEIPSSDG
jgi:ectoine hydroxylase-related dioxygenase (phytanoyl-CoA dioxygenase family)